MVKGLSQTLDGLNFPLSKAKKTEPQETESTPVSTDTGTSQYIKETISIPVEGKDSYWRIQDLSLSESSEGLFSKFIKRKDLDPEEISNLKKDALQSPGNTRAKVQKLKKQFPTHSELYMLSAICTHGMLLNSSNRDEVFRGMKYAAKEAATALMSNGISLYNCEAFYKIYFMMLERLKRAQAKSLGLISEDPRLANLRFPLTSAMKAVDFMISEKSKISNVLNHLKKKLKSSNYIALFNPMDIKDAAHKIEKGTPKEPCKIGTASEMISYVYAFGVTFAHTPLLSSLVDKIIRLLPDKDISLYVRKISINSIRRLTAYKLASAEGEKDEMIRIAQNIFKENLLGLSKFGNQAVYHSFEADLFFNLAYIAELTPGLFSDTEYLDVNEKAMKAMETLAEKDMSKNHSYMENANTHIRRLEQIRSDRQVQGE